MADIPASWVEAWVAFEARAQKRSAVFDIVTNPTKVLVELA